jgi:hypothetical protein
MSAFLNMSIKCMPIGADGQRWEEEICGPGEHAYNHDLKNAKQSSVPEQII